MRSFKISITSLIVLSLVIVLGGLSTLTYVKTRSLLTNNLEKAFESLAKASSAQVGEWLAARKSEMELIARKNIIINGDKKIIMDYLNQETHDNTLYEQFFVADTEGNYYLNSGQTGSVADRDYFQKVVSSGMTVISDPLISRGSGNQIIVVAAPIRKDGKIIGIIGGNVNISKLWHEVSNIKIGNTGYAIILQQDGLMIVHPDPNKMMKYNPLNDKLAETSTKSTILNMLNMNTGYSEYLFHGEKRLLAYAPIPNIRWSLGIVVPAAYITSQLKYLPAYFGGLTVILMVLLSLLLKRWLIIPLSSLTKVTTFMASEPVRPQLTGQINSPVKEISALIKNFNNMEITLNHNFQSLEESNQALKLSEERFAKAFYASANMKSIVNLSNFRYQDVNEGFAKVKGWTREEIIGKTPFDFGVSREEMENIFRLLKEDGSIRNLEMTVVAKDGSTGTALLSAEQIEINGEICGMFDYTEITDLKKMQLELARLDRLNLVGQMAAGIGHEIRNPMTTVRGYLQLLGSKPQYQAQKSTFDLMISELDRANMIITDFLSLAKTKKTEMEIQNLNDILSHLYPLLEADTYNQNKQIEFISGSIPDLELNKKEISQLILNLARNGLEAMKENGRLTIATFLNEDQVILTVEDEGCGIPVENLNKLGTPFFTTKDFGTGLGLATCFKIAEAHNAKINIDSSPKGTKFLIAFPVPVKKTL